MKETNMEHFRGEIEKASFRFGIVDGKIISCDGGICGKCDFSCESLCMPAVVRWLMSEYKPEPVLTAREQGFVEGIEGGYIVRDKNGNLTWYAKLPIRDNLNGFWYMSRGSSSVDLNEYYFPFITWEDEEPWSIERLRELKVQDAD